MKGAVIDFAGQWSLWVKETKPQIEREIGRSLSTNGVVLLHLTDYADGKDVTVNAGQICTIRERADTGSH